MFVWNSTFEKEKQRADAQARRAQSADEKAQEAHVQVSHERERTSNAQKESKEERERAEIAERKTFEANQQVLKEKERASIAQLEREQEKERAKKAEKTAADAKQLASQEKERASSAQHQLEQARERKKIAEKKAAEANQIASQEKERANIAEQERDEEMERAKSAEIKAAEASQQAAEIKEKVEQKTKEEQQLKEQFKWGPRIPPKWSEEESQRLRNKFQKDLNTTKGHTFLLFGPTSHGKSSIGNGFMAALEDHELPPTYYHVAQSSESVSRAFRTKKYKVHRIIDMPGIFEGKAIKNEDIRKIVTGQVPWVSEITTSLETGDGQKSLNNTVECVIIILRYDMTDLPPELKRQIGVIWSLCGEGVLSCHLVLTHLDVCDPQFKDAANLPKIYNSAKVLKAVENMSKATGIPPYNISFVKNYTTESETDVNSHLQYLRILNVVKVSADQVIEARLTDASMTEDYRKQDEDNRKQDEDYRKQEAHFLNKVITLLTLTSMDIITLPATGSNRAIQENFLRQLSQRVNIKGNAVSKQIQILIFKPAGRPQEEFDNIIQVFKETGRRLDENLIFITATKPDRCKFEVPANFNFALQTCVFLNDENEIDPMSSDTMDKVADHLTRKYGLQPCAHENRSHGAVPGAAVFQSASETNVEEQRREINALKQENKELKLHAEEKEQKGQLEVKYLKEDVEDQKQENKRLKENVEKKEQEGQELQLEIKNLEEKLAEQKQENKGLKLDVEKKEQERLNHQSEIQNLEEKLKEQRRETNELQQENGELKLQVHQMERKRKRLGLKGYDQAGLMREIRFKYQEKSLLSRFLSRGEKMYSVNVHAVEEEIVKLEQGHYDFQRKYEGKFNLEPGRLRRVLEYIEDELKKLSGDNLILEGERFQNLTREVDKTFWLSADRFLEFLIQIHERNVHAK